MKAFKLTQRHERTRTRKSTSGWRPWLSLSSLIIWKVALICFSSIQCYQRDTKIHFIQQWGTSTCMELEGRGANKITCSQPLEWVSQWTDTFCHDTFFTGINWISCKVKSYLTSMAAKKTTPRQLRSNSWHSIRTPRSLIRDLLTFQWSTKGKTEYSSSLDQNIT